MKRHYVYETTNLINGKKYIGKRTCNCPIEEDRYMGSGKTLIKALNKYGYNNFKKEILKICYTEQEAYEIEKYFIKKFNAVESREYYNIKDGGQGFSSEDVKRLWGNEDFRLKCSNRVISKETRIKISNSLKANPNASIGMKGKIHTDEARTKISEALKGKEKTIEHKKKMSEISKKRYKETDMSEKMLEGILRKWEDEDFKKKMSNTHKGNKYMLGKKHTEASKIKMSEALKGKTPWNKGRKMTEEEAKKLSEARKGKGFKKVICLNNLKVFESLQNAGKCAGLKSYTSISNCCRGRRNYAGKINGEPAKWMYYEDYLKQNSNS